MGETAEQAKAEGRYKASCLGPRTPEEGQQIVDYVAAHPELTDPIVTNALKFLKERDCWVDEIPNFDKREYLLDLLRQKPELQKAVSGHTCRDVDLLYENPDSPNVVAAKILGIELAEKWAEDWHNVVCTEGKNLALDTYLAGSGYTVTGPYVGLISSVSYSAVAAGDTGAQINGTNGWKEAGSANAPTYTGNRKTAAWSAASAGSKALSAALAFAITGTGTLKGAFLLYGASALNTKDDAHGTLYSAGLFGTGDRAVLSGDTVNVSWSGSM